MKKATLIPLAAALGLFLTACGGTVSNAQSKAGTQNYSSTVEQVLDQGIRTAESQPTATPEVQAEAQPTPAAEADTSVSTPEPIVEDTPVITPEPLVSEVPAATPSPVTVTTAPASEPIPQQPESVSDGPVVDSGAPVDIDLTQMSSTLVYSQVYEMMTTPDKFLGKTVRMFGPAASSTVGDTTYHAVIIEDATACCAQGLEYQLCGGQSYPPDFDYVTVTGAFSTYREDGYLYAVLNGARIEG